MDARTLTVLGFLTVCLVGALWLTPLGGMLPPSVQELLPRGFGSDQLTLAPDEVQPPRYGGPERPQTQPSPQAESEAVTPPPSGQTASAPQPATPQTEPEPEPEQKPRLTTSNVVNVRAGQGTDYGVTGQIEPGETVTLMEDPGGDWIRVRGANVEGWVYRPLFEKTGG